MEDIISKLVDIAFAFGFGVILVLVVGFWLFGRLKKDAERLNDSENKSSTSEKQSAVNPDNKP